MTKILFVCHGSICRSPMAEFIFGDLVKKANLEASFQIESAAVSREELGNPVYPPARRVLAAHGIFCGSHRARQITKGDYAAFDYLIGMDRENLSGMRRVFGADPEGKLRLLLSFAGKDRDVADPWYTDDFEGHKSVRADFVCVEKRTRRESRGYRSVYTASFPCCFKSASRSSACSQTVAVLSLGCTPILLPANSRSR